MSRNSINASHCLTTISENYRRKTPHRYGDPKQERRAKEKKEAEKAKKEAERSASSSRKRPRLQAGTNELVSGAAEAAART